MEHGAREEERVRKMLVVDKQFLRQQLLLSNLFFQLFFPPFVLQLLGGAPLPCPPSDCVAQCRCFVVWAVWCGPVPGCLWTSQPVFVAWWFVVFFGRGTVFATMQSACLRDSLLLYQLKKWTMDSTVTLVGRVVAWCWRVGGWSRSLEVQFLETAPQTKWMPAKKLVDCKASTYLSYPKSEGVWNLYCTRWTKILIGMCCETLLSSSCRRSATL